MYIPIYEYLVVNLQVASDYQNVEPRATCQIFCEMSRVKFAGLSRGVSSQALLDEVSLQNLTIHRAAE